VRVFFRDEEDGVHPRLKARAVFKAFLTVGADFSPRYLKVAFKKRELKFAATTARQRQAARREKRTGLHQDFGRQASPFSAKG